MELRIVPALTGKFPRTFIARVTLDIAVDRLFVHRLPQSLFDLSHLLKFLEMSVFVKAAIGQQNGSPQSPKHQEFNPSSLVDERVEQPINKGGRKVPKSILDDLPS